MRAAGKLQALDDDERSQLPENAKLEAPIQSKRRAKSIQEILQARPSSIPNARATR